jgi:hypothetical protein
VLDIFAEILIPVGPVIDIAPPFPPLELLPPPAAPFAVNAEVTETFVPATSDIEPPAPPAALFLTFPVVVIAAATEIEVAAVKLTLWPGLVVLLLPPELLGVKLIALLTVILPPAFIVNVL